MSRNFAQKKGKSLYSFSDSCIKSCCLNRKMAAVNNHEKFPLPKICIDSVSIIFWDENPWNCSFFKSQQDFSKINLDETLNRNLYKFWSWRLKFTHIKIERWSLKTIYRTASFRIAFQRWMTSIFCRFFLEKFCQKSPMTHEWSRFSAQKSTTV